jgi:hypothetical protein
MNMAPPGARPSGLAALESRSELSDWIGPMIAFVAAIAMVLAVVCVLLGPSS